jgi:hypothetical protein
VSGLVGALEIGGWRLSGENAVFTQNLFSMVLCSDISFSSNIVIDF